MAAPALALSTDAQLALAAAGLACQAAGCVRMIVRSGGAPAWAVRAWLAGAACILALALVRRDPVLALGQLAALVPVLRPARRSPASAPEVPAGRDPAAQ